MADAFPAGAGGGLDGIDAVILAGGLGTRIQGVLKDVPKILAPVHGRPFLDHMADWLGAVGCRRLVLCLGHLAGRVVDHVAGRPAGPVAMVPVIEPEPLGTKGALVFARDALRSDPVLVLNGDSFVEADLGGFAARHRAAGCDLSILCVNVPDAGRFGRVEATADGHVARFVEKEPGGSAPGLINAGVYLISRALFDRMAGMPGSSFERDVLQVLPPGTVRIEIAPGPFIDIGTPESLAAAPGVVPTGRSGP